MARGLVVLRGPESLRAVGTVVVVIASVVSGLTAVAVFALLVWAALKDGEFDRSVQRRLGIRRKTRL